MTDVRDEILDFLKADDRPLKWLSKKTGIVYSTLYGCFVHRTFNLTQDNLNKINTALGTDFKH